MPYCVRVNKKDILKKLISAPKEQSNSFWAREYKLLKTILKKYPDLSFWEAFEIKEKPPSLKCLLNENFYRYVDRYYKKHIPKIKNPEIKLGQKEGRKMKINNKIKTIRKFIDND